MRFGVPRFGFNNKKPAPATETPAPRPERPAPQVGLPSWARPKSESKEPEWGAPIIEVNDQPAQPDWGAPIIEVNPNAVECGSPIVASAQAEERRANGTSDATGLAGSGPLFPPEPAPPIDREWGLEALAAEVAHEPLPSRAPSLADLAANIAARALQSEDVLSVDEAFNPFEGEPVIEPVRGSATNFSTAIGTADTVSMESICIETPDALISEPTMESAAEVDSATPVDETSADATDWPTPSLADRLSAYQTPVTMTPRSTPERIWDAEEESIQPEYPEANQEAPGSWPEAIAITPELVSDVTPVAAYVAPAIEPEVEASPAPQPSMEDTGYFSSLGHTVPAGALEELPVAPHNYRDSVEFDAPEIAPVEESGFTAQPDFVVDAGNPFQITAPATSYQDIDATPVILASVSPPVATPEPDAEPVVVVASTEPSAEAQAITSLQGMALAEELQLVSESLWSYKQYLEQFQGQIKREVDTALESVGQQLAAFEEQTATLRREFQVGMGSDTKVGILETGAKDLAPVVAALDQARQLQGKQLVMLENLTAITQRYGDLLEKVTLFEGNLKRYMKQVDGTAKSQLRQSSRQEFFASSAIIRSQETERQRIAREIHDGPAQAIANVILRLDLVEKMMQQRPEMVGKEFAKMKEIAQGALNEIRGFIFDLRPMTLKDLGLTATLKKIVQSNQALSECHFEFIVEGTETKLSDEQELAIFRIAQEALTNVKKHAMANNAYVHLKYLTGEVVLIVEDDGHGFEAHKNSTGDYTHFGMIGMQERAEDIDGDLQVISQKGRGTKIIFSLRTG